MPLKLVINPHSHVSYGALSIISTSHHKTKIKHAVEHTEEKDEKDDANWLHLHNW